MIRKQSADPVFDKVSIRLSDAVKRNMNQKYVFSEKNNNFRWAFDVNIPGQVPENNCS